MRLYLDCEWNGHGGELISMALCAEDGSNFYEVLPVESPTAWVSENVLPVLGKRAVTRRQFQKRFSAYLRQFSQLHLVADWPEDIVHFCRELMIEPGVRICTGPITVEILDRLDLPSEVPHNALSDAHALMEICSRKAKS